MIPSEFIQSLVVASSGLLSVSSISIVIGLLLSKNGRAKGLAYVLGYALSYTFIGIIVILGFSTLDNTFDNMVTVPNISSAITAFIFGGLLIVVGVRNWIKRKKDNHTLHSMRFLASLHTISIQNVFLIGIVISVINFKNLILYLSAVSVILTNPYDVAFKTFNVLIVTLIFCLPIISLIGVTYLFPHKSDHILNTIRYQLHTNQPYIGILIPVIFGLLFIIYGMKNI